MSILNKASYQPVRVYRGKVFHQRHGTLRHRLTYNVLSVCLELNQVDSAASSVPLFSFNRFNLFSVYEKDHMDEGYTDLQMFVWDMLLQSSLFTTADQRPTRIEMLAFPRFLGRAFNPISVFFCYGENEDLKAVLYQVRNTFGERHHYAFKIAEGEASIHQHSCDKQFYVSPFIEMDCTYDFRLSVPGEKASIVINQTQNQKPLLTASFLGENQPINRRTMIALAVSLFQSGWKILAAIHWEALKLWCKGAIYQRRPVPPVDPVSPGLSNTVHSQLGKGELS